MSQTSSDSPGSPATSDAVLGAAAAIGAFSLWGVFPLYWAQISTVPALEVIYHRIAWGAVLAWVIVFFGRIRSGRPAALVLRGCPARLLVVNGALLGINWFVYVWAVTSGHALDASLGYYINPLVSVLFGMLFFSERLRPLQWVAVLLAVIGVSYMTIRLGRFPWVSVTLAGTFGMYGVIKKKTLLSSIHGLALELTPLMVVAGGLIIHGVVTGRAAFLAGDPRITAYLFGASAVTVAPLLLFGIATRRIRLADVGFLQYIAPTLMFIIAVFVFNEPVQRGRMIGFIFVWSALIVYTYSSVVSRRRRSAARRREIATNRKMK